MIKNSSNNNDDDDVDFLCANILEGRAQWRDKIKALNNLVIVKHYASLRRMDEGEHYEYKEDRPF